MKLDFSALTCLIEHSRYLESIFKDQALFVVGGTIRDLLLSRTTAPTDIDITGKGNPDTIREHMKFDEDTMSRFRTEKYGTMTVMPKTSDEEDIQIQYEYTPFRAEDKYTDNRHPDSIIWSDSLLADSARRDFTINALYWTPVHATLSAMKNPSLPKNDPLHHCLVKQIPIVLSNHGCLILTDHQHIEMFVSSGVLPSQCVFFLESEDEYLPQSGLPNTPITQCIVDPQGGLLDLIDRKIKTVGDPATRYQEDALRLMRGLRFANSLNQGLINSDIQNSGFDFEKKTREQLVEHSQLIQNVAAERHYQELYKVFSSNNPFGYVSTLKTAGLLPYLFPALADTIDNHQPTRHHALDTFSHSLMVLYHIQQRCDDPLVKFAVLYHDVGKPEQYAFMENAKLLNPENPVREGFKHHAEISVTLAQKDFGALRFPKSSLETICRYIKWHHRPGEILDSSPAKREQKIRKLMSDGGYQETLNLIDIAVADRLGQYNPLQSPAIQELLDMQDTVRELYQNEGRFVMKNLVVNGNWLIETFDLEPGPQLGDMLERIFEWVLGDVAGRNNEKQIIRLVKQLMANTNG